MRITLILILLGLGLWQAAADWQSTIGQGYAYRFTTFGQALAENWPTRFGTAVASARPAMGWLSAIPIAATLLVLAGLLWLSRPRRR